MSIIVVSLSHRNRVNVNGAVEWMTRHKGAEPSLLAVSNLHRSPFPRGRPDGVGQLDIS